MTARVRPPARSSAVAIYPSRWKLVLFLCISTLFVSIAAFALAVDPEVRTVWWPYACLALFGAGMVVFARSLLRREPAVIIDERGIAGRGLRGGIGWDEIDDLFRSSFTHRASTQHFVSIVPRDPEKFLARQHWLRRILGTADEMFVGAPLNIPISHLERSPDEIVALVERYSGRRLSRD